MNILKSLLMRYRLLCICLILPFVVNAQGTISPDEYFPDEASTQNPYEYEIENAGSSSSQFVIAKDKNGTVEFYDVPTDNDLDRADTETGKLKYNREYNLSNVSDLNQWLLKRTKSFGLRANQISQKIQEKGGFGGTEDKGIAALASDYIYEHSDNNSTRRRVMDKVEDIYNKLRAKISNRKQIKCYISRKLKPGYMCPLPTKENSFIIGYSQKDDKKVSKKECDNRCKIAKACVSKNMPFALYKSIDDTQDLVQNPTIIIDTNPRQTIKTVSLGVMITNLDEDKLKKELYSFRYAVSYFYKGEWRWLFENYVVKPKAEKIEISFFMNRSAEKVKVEFFRPFERDPYAISYEILLNPSEHAYTLNNARVNYTDDKHYFCIINQFVFPDEDPTEACKNGTIKDLPTGSSVNQICVPDSLPDYRDPEFGAYKSKDMCEIECYESDECIPTYRQPSQLDYNGYIPSDKYDIEIGCIDDPNNEACTPEICKEFYLNDTRPVNEKVWTNNDDIVTTIQDGTRVDGVTRPKIDVEAELSSNGGSKDKVFKDEMKDIAYNAMIERGTYNVSSLTVNKVYPSQSAYEYKEDKISKRASVSWLFKGKSNQYDDGKDYYFYIVMSVDVIYHPIKAISVDQHTIYASEDPNIRAIDRLFMVKTDNGWQIFKRIEYLKMYVKNSEGRYEWKNTAASSISRNVTFSNNEFVAYGGADLITQSVKKKLDSGTPYETFNISLDINQMINQIRGVLFVAQIYTDGGVVKKVFSDDPGDIDETTRAFLYSYGLYGLYYDSKVSLNKIRSEYDTKKFFDFMERGAFQSEIRSETLYSDDKVKLYIHGTPENISVNAHFTPTSEEEGKKTFFFNFLYEE